MHFSSSYSQLLLTLPPDLRDNAIEYRQLKKLINQVVAELSGLGLSPEVLQTLLESSSKARFEELSPDADLVSSSTDPNVSGLPESMSAVGASIDDAHPTIVYELVPRDTYIEPRLRFSVQSVNGTELPDSLLSSIANGTHGHSQPPTSILEAVQAHANTLESSITRDDADPDTVSQTPSADTDSFDSNLSPGEVVIPLRSDAAFFRLLSSALTSLSTHLATVHDDFIGALRDLSLSLSSSARPASASASPFHSFTSYSPVSTDAGTLRVSGNGRGKSDLYAWREVLQMYVDAEVFEGVSESRRGERSIEEVERRWNRFTSQLEEGGFVAKQEEGKGHGRGGRMKLASSAETMEAFLRMNVFILDLKKFQYATSEATRKILKKHTKRTALPLPPYLLSSLSPSSPSSHNSSSPDSLALMPAPPTSLPRLLVQALSETVLPIVPHLDDYACLICTSLAFKPIRLRCGHLFCVRCLVKLQKRGRADCPMCRSPTVLAANRQNVDWALLNFMQDWFPVEAKAKLKQNEREAAEEELQELGIRAEGCVVV
ncbi:hypothetical protein CONPUDRAFT_140639 [Coniophora puteana RWD-64-598 SS2]|uniref:RING-14 protein n=1 Tax=Coniophora puteana (strain RWD-64-598) TaxID=741705 RepID=R7SE57_CONPW|nr:uncharacterized protein CONPUDRAFT_140639 [Coniophora puteana RWD-64-598 SS2]EIW74032.1 hypothetical protein CONPUDRAFT_140639 [Coniophora puteana RWD-64-598 SS2]